MPVRPGFPQRLSIHAGADMPYREQINGIEACPAGVNILRGDLIAQPQDELQVLLTNPALPSMSIPVTILQGRRFYKTTNTLEKFSRFNVIIHMIKHPNLCPRTSKQAHILSYLAGMHIKGHHPRSLYYGGVAGDRARRVISLIRVS